MDNLIVSALSYILYAFYMPTFFILDFTGNNCNDCQTSDVIDKVTDISLPSFILEKYVKTLVPIIANLLLT